MDDQKVTESANMSGEGAESDSSQQEEGVFASDDNRREEITGKNNGHRQRRQWAKARQAGTALDPRHMPSNRRVSFPKHDSELVTGYLEPANPWAISKPNLSAKELIEIYRKSCSKHDVEPLMVVVKHLEGMDFQNMPPRGNSLILRDSKLTPASCEALEEILKRIQYKLIDLTSCDLDDSSASAMFDMIEFYEAATELDISENRAISHRGWQACAAMIKKSQALNILLTSGTTISDSNASNLGKALMSSAIHTLKLEHCGLTGRPLSSLCSALKKNMVLKELWLAHNDLNCYDAYTIGNLLKANFYLQFLDISNNSIEDNGVCHIAEALIKQSQFFRNATNPGTSEKATTDSAAMQKFEPKKALPPVVRPVAPPTPAPEAAVVVEKPPQPTTETPATCEKSDDAARLDGKLVTIYEGMRNNNNLDVQGGKQPSGIIPNTLDNTTEKEFTEGESDDKTSEDEKNVQSPVLVDAEHVKEATSDGKAMEEIELKIIEKVDDAPKPPEVVVVHAAVEEPQCPNNNSARDAGDRALIESDKSVNELCTSSLIDINRNPVKETVAGDVTQTASGNTLPPELCAEATINEMLSFTNSNETTIKEGSVPTEANLDYERTQKSPKCSSDMTPDSPASFTVSQSLDSSMEFPENSPSYDCVFDVPATRQIIPERSLSSESLNSETSVESNDSKSSIKLAESKFSKNGTLERQTMGTVEPPPITAPSGLQVLVLWNNRITKKSAAPVSDVLKATTTLEILNIGKNILSNDFVTSIKANLITNTSLTNLGLQSSHLTCVAAKTLGEVLATGPNGVLQRVDLRDNNIQIPGITSLNDALKVNKSLTRLDLDNTLKRYDSGTDTTEYSRLLTSIRAQCRRNEQPLEPRDPIKPTAKRARSAFLPSRKISLTCSTRSPLDLMCAGGKSERQLLDTCRKSGGRLRSPLPSPNPSPSASPVPSPSRSRFQVSRVIEGASPLTPPSSTSSSPTNSFTSSRFRVTTIKEQKPVTPPVTQVPIVATTPIIVEKIAVPERVEMTKIEVIDSPDMEVSRLLTTTDDNSSIGSADSFDRVHDLNTSLSSTDSLDMLGSEPVVVFGEKLKGSLSSQESLSDSTQQESFCSMSSNESTLTSSVQLVTKEQLRAPQVCTKSPERRVRKTSRTLAPILQIFQNPVALIAQKMDKKLDIEGQENATGTHQRHDSPIGELLARVTGAGRKETSSEDITPVDAQPTTVLQANVSPENVCAVEVDVLAADCIPVALKQEMKENISPEHTITASNVDLLQEAIAQATKVKFEVGSGDDDTETEDLSQKLDAELPTIVTEETHTLGQIARDSLSILNRHDEAPPPAPPPSLVPSVTPIVQQNEK
ncbi:mucin-5AC [Lutzomyia longipalpis]|uniref:mucin-5AC n=1 Tax=Lutzomyia longipalpis TaxID=7200 RepID=UPI00248437FF|nr:mucin-5AC [Lutzomyia longipalpis]